MASPLINPSNYVTFQGISLSRVFFSISKDGPVILLCSVIFNDEVRECRESSSACHMAGSQQTFVDETLNGVLCIVAVSRQVVSDYFATPWTVAHQAPLSMRFFRQGYWGGLPFPSPWDLPKLEIKSVSPALAGGVFITEPPGKP